MTLSSRTVASGHRYRVVTFAAASPRRIQEVEVVVDANLPVEATNLKVLRGVYDVLKSEFALARLSEPTHHDRPERVAPYPARHPACSGHRGDRPLWCAACDRLRAAPQPRDSLARRRGHAVLRRRSNRLLQRDARRCACKHEGHQRQGHERATRRGEYKAAS